MLVHKVDEAQLTEHFQQCGPVLQVGRREGAFQKHIVDEWSQISGVESHSGVPLVWW